MSNSLVVIAAAIDSLHGLAPPVKDHQSGQGLKWEHTPMLLGELSIYFTSNHRIFKRFRPKKERLWKTQQLFITIP